MDPFIRNIYTNNAVVGRSGQRHELRSSIDPEEGTMLSDIIQQDPTVLRTLEVGCAYGLSALFICTALRDRDGASHTIIDPFQNTQWDGAGLKNLEDAGISFYRHIEAKSEFALPRIVEQEEGTFDLVFIDGWHTFDHTLVDCFYATRLLKVGGYLVIDDVHFPSVHRAVNFLSEYPCYEIHSSVKRTRRRSFKRLLAKVALFPLVPLSLFCTKSPLFKRVYGSTCSSMVALRKTCEDSRNWDWHSDAW